MHRKIEEKRGLLSELQAVYDSKQQLMRRYMSLDTGADPALEQELATLLYPRDANRTEIQTDLVRAVTGLAEKRALNVLNFQLLEDTQEAVLSDASVLIRVSGQIRAAIELLKDILEARPILTVKDVEISGSGNTYTVKLIVTGYIRRL
ncbi:GspMb/PilO family protein [Candidatus Magnetobacterium casense]|uniref:Uncharacterized protein n=1 Tax=Candidatus Magnetobacterium casense TaxID=1455061 RepID=A0ABS6S0Q4_9BACT|nr:GspMb/PilO family protein [Candidatus Magnetobacterium casensis]MBV6341978.1 hypothetical protein [Candidatus Magnetobacterium casensis]